MKGSITDQMLAAQFTRRRFLSGAGTLAGLVLTARHQGIALAQPKYAHNPFSLGVASGDPLPTGVVLWTRLAPDPFNGGGMPPVDAPVRWQVAADENLKTIVQQGTVTASAALGHSVHIEVAGLQPARTYWYQFESGGVVSPSGRTRTAPAFTSHPAQLRFAFASCQQWQSGYYAAYRHLAADDLDFIVHLGDYIYEGRIGENTVRAEVVPPQVRPEPMTVEDYRLRYALYKRDPHLQAAHAAFPFIVTWDDHEVENNYASSLDENGSPPAEFLRRRAAAYQVYYEHMPLRLASLPHGPDALLYRRLAFGDLAEFNVLDTRQYRSDQACGDGRKPRCAENLDPTRVFMGATQEKWLLEGLDRSHARWNVLAQQIIMTQYSRTAPRTGDTLTFNMDAWDGYPVERARLLNFLGQRRPSNPIVLAGDSHTNLVSELKTDFDRRDAPTVGVEFAGTAISSTGIQPASKAGYDADIATQPHIKWFEGIQRGYVRCTLDRQVWRSDYQLVDDVHRADSPVRIGASWVVEDGKPGVQRA